MERCSPSRCHSAEGNGLMCVCPRWYKLEVQPSGVPRCPTLVPDVHTKPSPSEAAHWRCKSECPSLGLRNTGSAGLREEHLDQAPLVHTLFLREPDYFSSNSRWREIQCPVCQIQQRPVVNKHNGRAPCVCFFPCFPP